MLAVKARCRVLAQSGLAPAQSARGVPRSGWMAAPSYLIPEQLNPWGAQVGFNLKIC
jgi:hypothetical protein